MFMPLTPLRSLSTLLSCTFISINTFCIRWMALLASAHQIASLPPQDARHTDLYSDKPVKWRLFLPPETFPAVDRPFKQS
jgi:hypothetical protein